jgi:tRNA(adenine34) deaminase
MNDIDFMRIAFEEALIAYKSGEIPVGAVLVKDGVIISKAHNKRESLNDPTAHAEVIALREGARILGNWRLIDTTLYVTKEPCIMCAGAMLNARIKRLVYGCKDERYGAINSIYTLFSDGRLNHEIEVVNGVLKDECSKILRNFFEERRLLKQ